jgi:hypothetical protein
MYFYRVPPQLSHGTPILEMLIDCLLSASASGLHELCLWFTGKSIWALDVSWVLASIAVISLHSFMRPKCRHKSVRKDADVRPFSTCISIGLGLSNNIAYHKWLQAGNSMKEAPTLGTLCLFIYSASKNAQGLLHCIQLKEHESPQKVIHPATMG